MFPLTEALCELVGAYIGDGCSGSHGNLVQFTGDASLDKQYFEHFLIPTLHDIPFSPHYALRIVDGTTLRLTSYSKQLHSWFVDFFGFPLGPKTHIVTIPRQILQDDDYARACLRGIFDTDGTLYFDRRPAYKRPYPRIELHMRSKKLLKQVYVLLWDFGIIAHLNDDCSRVQINGFENCKDFIKNIGFTNMRHKEKAERL